jgi:antitoxin CptB
MNSGSSLLWRCRRGIREMDILLQRFIETQYDDLSSEEQKIFEQLLEETDMDIMAWVMEKAIPPSEEFAQIIQLIREVYSSNH